MYLYIFLSNLSNVYINFLFLSGPYLKNAPSTTSWLHNIVSKDASEKELLDYANTSYPILHERVLPLVHDFLQVNNIMLNPNSDR